MQTFLSAAEVVVSNLRRIRLRSNSTGTKHSSPREQGSPQCFGNQLETPDRQRLSPGRKVPKSASVSTLSLIITPGQTPQSPLQRYKILLLITNYIMKVVLGNVSY